MSAYSVLVQRFFCQIQHNPNLAIEKVSSVKQVYPTDTRWLQLINIIVLSVSYLVSSLIIAWSNILLEINK